MKCTLGGKAILAYGSVPWSLKEGSRPVIHTYDMIPSDAASLLNGGGPVQLVITPDQGSPITVKNLWILNVGPGDNKFLSKVQVADRRWMWSYSHVLRRYNMRRNVGTKRLVANDQVPAVNDIAAKIAYWDWSLNKGVPWIPKDMLLDVLGSASDADRQKTGSILNVNVDGSIGSQIRSLPIEELTIDDAGDSAVDRALSYLPEAMLYIDYDGNAVVESRASGKERDVISTLLPEVDGEGHVDLVKNNLIRPKEVHVYFTREIELRFNFVEETLSVGQTTTNDPVDGRVMDNVLPSPDYQTTISGQTIPQGTWITFPQAFNAWGDMPVVGKKLDHDILQKAFIPGVDLWAMLRISGNFPDNNGDIKPWAFRYNACQNHYRTTFRLSPRFMDRIFSLRAYRLTTIDPQSGQRGPASAYGDFAVMYTQQTLLKSTRQGVSPTWADNYTAYPTSGNLDSSALVSPCDVSIVDHDQGIVHLQYKPNPIYGMGETVLPSQIQQDSLPTADISNRTKPIAFNSVLSGIKPPRLSPAYKCAIVLTAVPGAPNTIQQLHKIVVRPGDISSMIPSSQQSGLGEASGPPMEIRIGANIEVARVAWNDDPAKVIEIEKCFGLTEGEPNLAGLVINEDAQSNLVNGASLNAIAKAAAARLYASLADRFEGQMAGYINGQVRPSGWATEVRHEVMPDGMAVTRVMLPPSVPQMNLLSFLDSNSRQAILRAVQPL
jgi:hypothetical protein